MSPSQSRRSFVRVDNRNQPRNNTSHAWLSLETYNDKDCSIICSIQPRCLLTGALMKLRGLIPAMCRGSFHFGATMLHFSNHVEWDYQ